MAFLMQMFFSATLSRLLSLRLGFEHFQHISLAKFSLARVGAYYLRRFVLVVAVVIVNSAFCFFIKRRMFSLLKPSKLVE